GVHVPVDVVDGMETPEEGNAVVDAVPVPERVVEQKNRRRRAEQPPRSEKAEQPQAPFGRAMRDRQENGNLQQLDYRETDSGHRDVAACPPELGFAATPQRPQRLQKREHEKPASDHGRRDPAGHPGAHGSASPLAFELDSMVIRESLPHDSLEISQPSSGASAFLSFDIPFAAMDRFTPQDVHCSLPAGIKDLGGPVECVAHQRTLTLAGYSCWPPDLYPGVSRKTRRNDPNPIRSPSASRAFPSIF